MNKLEELIACGQNISVTIGIRDLEAFGKSLITQTREQLLHQTLADGQLDRMLSTEDVATVFKVHRTTLCRWDEKGILKSVPIGGERRYKLSDVKELINQKTK